MVETAKRVKEAIESSGVCRIAMIDDAFDPPDIQEHHQGDLLGFLQGEKAGSVRKACGIQDGEWKAAEEALLRGEHDSDEVSDLVKTLYDKFLEKFDAKFDPGGVFSSAKGDNLTFIKPLVTLLRSCKNVTVTMLGSEDTDDGLDQVDVLFVDLILSKGISGSDTADTAEANEAVQRSLDRAGKLLDGKPSVILMSSHAERGKREAETYREKLQHKVYASRFSFVDKGKVQGETPDDVKVEGEAAEALLDIFQSYTFGRGLSEALDQWLSSASVAATDLGKEIRQLQLKEIAYLVKFRLASEGQDLQEYLEWFFGECLLDDVGRRSDEAKQGKQVGNLLEPGAAKRIDGHFEPTTHIARMFHRVRIEPPRAPPRKNFRLGDLYLDVSAQKVSGVLAVMNPDCDLMLRDNGRRSTKTLLTVSGTLHSLDELSTSMGDFVIVDDKPYNIEWDYNNVRSFAFNGAFEKANASGADYRYIGCLRPMYAQEIQAHLLTHLGRVGVAVPPVIGMPAVATVVVFNKGGSPHKVPIPHDSQFNCSVLPSRAEKEKGRVIFDRSFVGQLNEGLRGLDPAALDLNPAATDPLKQLKADKNGALTKALFSGVELEKSIAFGILPTSKTPSVGKGGSWCCLHIESIRSEVAIVGAENAVGTDKAVPAMALEMPPQGIPTAVPAAPKKSWWQRLLGGTE